MTAARALPPRLANRLCSLLNEHAAACSLNDILDGNVAAITIVRRNPTASNARPHAPSPSRPLRRAGSPCFLETVRGVQIPIAGRVAPPLPRQRAVSSAAAFRTPAPVPVARPSWGRRPKSLAGADSRSGHEGPRRGWNLLVGWCPQNDFWEGTMIPHQ